MSNKQSSTDNGFQCKIRELLHYRDRNHIYCGVLGSPCLSKTGLILARIFSFLMVCQSVHAKGLTACVPSQPGAKAVLWRPCPAGTQQYANSGHKAILKLQGLCNVVWLRIIKKLYIYLLWECTYGMKGPCKLQCGIHWNTGYVWGGKMGETGVI